MVSFMHFGSPQVHTSAFTRGLLRHILRSLNCVISQLLWRW